jgi:RNA polymerase sigma factor (sigma-70 family)
MFETTPPATPSRSRPIEPAANVRAAAPPAGAARPEPCACAAAASPDDAALVAGCLRGEANCWKALVHRYQRLVFAIVRRIGLDEHAAADVFQTVYSRLLGHLPRIAEPSRLQAWIVTTTKREALLQRKQGERWVSMTREVDADEGRDDAWPEWDIADESPQAEQALAALQQLNLVRLGLERLDPKCRNLMRMLFDDADAPPEYGEVAARLGMAVGSIGPTRARCLAKLRTYVT